MSKLARDHRNSDVIKIQIAKKELNLPDAEYRAILLAQGGVGSSKDLTHEGRLRVLAYLQKQGWKPKASTKPKRPSRPTPKADALPLVRRIRAQLISLDRLPDTKWPTSIRPLQPIGGDRGCVTTSRGGKA